MPPRQMAYCASEKPGRSAVLTAAGPGAGPHVIAYDGLSLAALDSFFAYDAFSGGVFLGG